MFGELGWQRVAGRGEKAVNSVTEIRQSLQQLLSGAPDARDPARDRPEPGYAQ